MQQTALGVGGALSILGFFFGLGSLFLLVGTILLMIWLHAFIALMEGKFTKAGFCIALGTLLTTLVISEPDTFEKAKELFVPFLVLGVGADVIKLVIRYWPKREQQPQVTYYAEPEILPPLRSHRYR